MENIYEQMIQHNEIFIRAPHLIYIFQYFEKYSTELHFWSILNKVNDQLVMNILSILILLV